MSDNIEQQRKDKELLDQIDNKVRSAAGLDNASIAEFLYEKTKKFSTRNKGLFGISGLTTEPYPVCYPNSVCEFPKIENELFKSWFEFFKNDKIPRIYQRWALISLVGAILERNIYIQEGSDKIFPNTYIALVGDSGTGKTRMIKRVLEFIKTMGYDKVTTATTTREKFVEDLENGFKPPKKAKKDFNMDEDIFADEADNNIVHPGYIVAEEWKDFFKSQGSGNEEWISLLEKAYDCPDTLDNRVKTGKGSSVKFPVTSLLGAVTPDGLNDFTKPKPYTDVPVSGRVFTIYSPTVHRKVSDDLFLNTDEVLGDHVVNNNLKFQIVRMLNDVRDLRGRVTWDSGVEELFNFLVSQPSNRHIDTQHTPYYNRRELHLKKLCIIFAAMSGELKITKEVLIYAEEVLLFAESFLPVAVGFPMYGFSDYSSKRIMQLLNRSHLIPIESLLDRVSAVIPDRERFEKQKQTLSAANRIDEKVITVKNPAKADSAVKSFYISKLMDYRLFSVLKSVTDEVRIYEYFYSISEILTMWENKIDIEDIKGGM